MKYFIYSLFLFCFVLLFESCDYLDYSEIGKYQGAKVWNDRYRIRDALVAGYGDITSNLTTVGGANRSSGGDDSEDGYNLAGIQKINDGRWSAVNTVDSRWGANFTGIRQMNDFLEHFSVDSIRAKQYNDDYQQIVESWRSYPYQARFARAILYFRLIKRFENVPIVTKTLTTQEANSVEPSSYNEVTQFIVSECDSIAPYLPIDYNNEPFKQTGRATRGAALALKAKALLYAASPLHNPSNDLDKWKEAARAAKVIIDAGWYSLEPNYSDLFNNTKSKETIFDQRYGSSNYFEADNFPKGYEGSNNRGTYPTQNLVNSYEMQQTGLPIDDPNSGYDPTDPYKGRDPRLKETIIVNDSPWKGRKVEIWKGGRDGPPERGATKTGYYLKKYVIEGISLTPSNTTSQNHVRIIFRYGEILLDYAEAMNEAYGPNNAAGLGMTARQAVNKIRERVNMPDFPSGMTKDQFRTKLHNERRVELAFENQRFWDFRRWKIKPATNIKGMKVTKQADGSFTYKKKTVEHRVWDDKMFRYPIPQNELYINKNLKQNPGW